MCLSTAHARVLTSSIVADNPIRCGGRSEPVMSRRHDILFSPPDSYNLSTLLWDFIFKSTFIELLLHTAHTAKHCGEMKTTRNSGLWSLRMMGNAAWWCPNLVDDARSGDKQQTGQDNPSGAGRGAKVELVNFSYVCLLFRYFRSGQPEPWTARRKEAKRRCKMDPQKTRSCRWAKHFWTISESVFWT